MSAQEIARLICERDCWKEMAFEQEKWRKELERENAVLKIEYAQLIEHGDRIADANIKVTTENAALRKRLVAVTTELTSSKINAQEDKARLDWLYLTAEGINWQLQNMKRITRDSIDAARKGAQP